MIRSFYSRKNENCYSKNIFETIKRLMLFYPKLYQLFSVFNIGDDTSIRTSNMIDHLTIHHVIGFWENQIIDCHSGICLKDDCTAIKYS